MSERHAAEKNSDSVFSDLKVDEPPGFLFVDHIAIAVLSGELETQVRMYKQIGFRELHREEIGGSDQVREVLLQIGESPNLIQLVEPMSADSPVQKQIDRMNEQLTAIVMQSSGGGYSEEFIDYDSLVQSN